MLFDKLDTVKMHVLDTSNVSSRVESRRDEPSGILALANTSGPPGTVFGGMGIQSFPESNFPGWSYSRKDDSRIVTFPENDSRMVRVMTVDASLVKITECVTFKNNF